MAPDDKPFTPGEIMKAFTLRNSNEALVAAVAALSLFSAVVTVTLAPRMAQAADVVDSRELEYLSDGQRQHPAGRIEIAGLESRRRRARGIVYRLPVIEEIGDGEGEARAIRPRMIA